MNIEQDLLRLNKALAAELCEYKETLSICQDRNARAHAETAAANARIRELEAERDEALRMEAQAHARVAGLEAKLAVALGAAQANADAASCVVLRIRELEAWLRRGIDLMEYSHEQRGLCPDDEHEWMERAETMIRSGPESVPNSALRLTAETEAYCATCEDGECAVHPHTSDRGAAK